MTDVIISLRVNEQLHNEMKRHDEINWSAVMRNSIKETIEDVNKIDTSRAKRATKDMNELRRLRVFDKGKNSGEIIRKWRDKRR